MWKLKLMGFKHDNQRLQVIKEIWRFNKSTVKEAKKSTDYFPQIVAYSNDRTGLLILSGKLKTSGAICYVRKCSKIEKLTIKCEKMKIMLNSMYGKVKGKEIPKDFFIA